VGWRPVEGVGSAEQIFRQEIITCYCPSCAEKALVCSASGEPGKDDVLLGRLLRHVGAQASFTVSAASMARSINASMNDYSRQTQPRDLVFRPKVKYE
jgi:hypothetical protein